MSKNVRVALWPPFRRSGTEITQRTAGDTLGLYKSALGTTTVPTVNLVNSTAAADGAQQYSPAFMLRGYGWKTAATAGSQAVDFRSYVLPAQGTSAPTGKYVIQSRINEGSWSDCMTINQGGTGSFFGGIYSITGTIGSTGSAITPTITGSFADGASAVGGASNNTIALTTAGAKLWSWKNAGIEKAYIDKDGSLNLNKTGTATVGTTTYNSPDIVLQSSAWDTDGSEDVWSWKFRNVPISGSTTVSNIQFVIQKNSGAETIPFSVSNSGTAVGTIFQGVTFLASSNLASQLRGNIADGATAIASKIGNTSALSTSGAKIASFYSDNFITEKAYIDKDGTYHAGSAYLSSTVVFAGIMYANTFGANSGNSMVHQGRVTDGATAIAHKFNSANSLTTSGAKIASFYSDNGSTEKAYIDKDGSLQLEGRTLGKQGVDVASANDITLGLGNYHDITGTGQINRIAKAGWTAGSRNILQFDDVVTVKDAQAGDATYASILVSSSTDYVSAAGSMVELVFDGTSFRLYPIFAE